MNRSDLVYRSPWQRTVWWLVPLGVGGGLLAGVGLGHVDGPADALPLVLVTFGLCLAGAAVWSLYLATGWTRADAYGLHSWTLLRRRSVPWQEVADLLVRVQTLPRGGENERVMVVLRGGRRLLLPQPSGAAYGKLAFSKRLAELRRLHALHGTPESTRIRYVRANSVGSGRVGRLCGCLLLLATAGTAAWFVPAATAYQRAWEVAAPCPAGASAAVSYDCLSTFPAVISRTEVRGPKQPNWLYFAHGAPTDRLRVSDDAAGAFRAGDRVQLTVWHAQVMKVAGKRYVWHEHVTTGGSVAVAAAVLALAAGYPAAQVLLRLRGRWHRRPDDETLPSVLPFAGALAGTAAWLLPLCYLHPTGMAGSTGRITWLVLGSLVSVALFALAWRATRFPAPEHLGAPLQH
ncbi:PH domain-containing protein [Streptomyces incarnatus]|uniref:PH domain-containing protein n=1 Tax=Streptomyces incarnatus TaxID=665007 RepID=UPI001AD84F7F|nr:PH domain-containing protein [Streptomyces incarnatus]